MKPTLITLILAIAFTNAKAQQTDTVAQDKIFLAVEKEPSFKGGMERFYQFLSGNIHYPANAVKNRIEGKVFITFIVERDGALDSVKVLRGVSEDIDAEAIRVVSISPKWTPGIQNGRVVRARFNMGIVFKLPPPQPAANTTSTIPDSIMNLPFDKKVFTAVEMAPQFPGGIQNLYKYLMQNVRYPAKSFENHIQGKVLVTFVVEKDGSLSDIRVLRKVSEDIDAEALRVMKNSPKWNPGMQNGRSCRVQYTVPVSFTISN